MDIKEKIEKLQIVVHSEFNENKLIEKGNELLDSLRQCWRSQKNEFTETDIQLLQRISLSIEAVQEFSEVLEEFQYVTDKEDVDEIIGSLYSVLEKIEGLAVKARVQKEIRELLEKRANLPTRESLVSDLKLSRAISQLDSSNRVCKKCGARMVIREGASGYFWGCSTFPRCWGKSCLTKEERNIIQG